MNLPKDWYEQFLADQEAAEAKFKDPENIKTLKAEVASRLTKLGTDKVEVHFDGVGDSGQIDHIEPDLPQDQYDYFEKLVYNMLEVFHPGWENNDGASGGVTFYPDEIEYDFNSHISSVEYHGHNF